MAFSGIDIHEWILAAVIIFNIAAYIFMGIATVYLSRKSKEISRFQADFLKFQNELQAMHKKVMDENDDFFAILKRFNELFDMIIKRQGKIGGIIGTVIREHRRHDRKVSHILQIMGATVPDDDESDHLPNGRFPIP